MKRVIPAALIAIAGVATAADPAVDGSSSPTQSFAESAAEALKRTPLTVPAPKVPVSIALPGAKCFYIQTIRPVPDSKAEGGPRFIPIQWRAVDLKADSVCVGGGKLYEAVLRK